MTDLTMHRNYHHPPGYSGYLRNFQRNHVPGGGREQPASKYADFEVEQHGLMADARMRSEHVRAFDASRFLRHQQAQPNGSTRSIPSHKDSRQAARIVAATKPAEEKARWNWQQGAAGAASSSYTGEQSPEAAALARLELVPPAGRPREASALYGTTYGDSIGTGVRPASAPVHPRYPNPPVDFASRGEMLPPLDSTLNKSLAQAIASLPAADNILKGNVDLHGSYSRDFGHRGHHPLQRGAGLVGGPPVIHAGSITSGSAASAYSRALPSHVHNFPSAALIGPSGAKVGPHPIEGLNEYPSINYNLEAFEREQEEKQSMQGSSSSSPFLRRPRTVGDSINEQGTTKELFAGSTKLSRDLRIPGYAGFVPASAHNQLALTGNPPLMNQDHHALLHTFQFDMPGYTGHNPRCVVNLRGPRSPRGKKRMNEGLVASLILDSMKI